MKFGERLNTEGWPKLMNGLIFGVQRAENFENDFTKKNGLFS